MAVIERAHTIRSQTGSKVVNVQMEQAIGEGYLVGGADYRITNNARVVFNPDGTVRTAFPFLFPFS